MQCKKNDVKVVDFGTIIAISLTMLVSLGVNIMAVYGVTKAKIPWIFPFLVLYMGFILECCLTLTFTLLSKIFRNINSFSISCSQHLKAWDCRSVSAWRCSPWDGS